MAETFTRASAQISSAGLDVYTAPSNAADRAIVLSIMVANVSSGSAADVTCQLKDSAGADISGGRLAKGMTVPAGTTLEIVANKVVMLNGEKLHFIASTSGDLEVSVSALEMT